MHQLHFSLAQCYCFNLRFYPDLIRAKTFIVHATIYIGTEYAFAPMLKYMPNLMIFYLVIFYPDKSDIMDNKNVYNIK